MSSADQLKGPRGESLQDRGQAWHSAFAGTDFLGTQEYLVVLSPRANQAERIYAILEIGSLGAKLDVPLKEHTPENELRGSINLHPTLWGDIDPGGYREATDTHNMRRLLASLNRISTGANTSDGVPVRFYDMLGLRHGEQYNSVFIGSHVGSTRRGYNFDATVEPVDRELQDYMKHAPDELQIESALRFTQLVEKSLPHLTVKPLSVNDYLQEARKALGFLPSDVT